MISDSLLAKINIPPSNFHPVNTSAPDVQTSAALYEKELINYFSLKPNELPQFDLVLLGLGPDGHTASLFPNHPALEETKRLVLGLEAKGIPEKRITLTLPVINHARSIFFLVNGLEKAEILKRILDGKEKVLLPAPRVALSPQVSWFVDQAAVSLLETNDETSAKK